MDLVIYEENKPFVLEELEEGDFDYIDAASEVYETEFFRFIGANRLLAKLAATYPTPRQKQEVPMLLYVGGNLSMRLHGVHSYNAFPMVVRVGGMLNAFGHKMGRKVHHPDTGDVTLSCEGFNKKNKYDRQTPCDQDFLRKISKDTDADALMRWFGGDVVRALHKRRVFKKGGIYIGDASYLFVPDNPNYEGSVRLLFDEHGHPVGRQAFEKMNDEKKVRCQLRRCYKMVTLLYTNRDLEFFQFVAVRVLPGNANECPVLYQLVDAFVEAVGKGVMKRLIVDRGFIDGHAISRCKEEHGVDVLIPVRKNMDIYRDAMALFEQPKVKWSVYEPPVEAPSQPARPRPEVIEKRERKRKKTLSEKRRDNPPASRPPEKTVVKTEVAAIGGFESWSSCTVPLTVVASREHYADGHDETWMLLDTKKVKDGQRTRQDYHLRTAIEERYRQLKCFSDLCNFTSRAFSMVVNQVVFVMLAYDLMQYHLLRKGRKDLTNKTPPRIRQQLLPTDNYIIVYRYNYYGLFAPLEFTGIVVDLPEGPRKKIAHKCRRLSRELSEEGLRKPRPP
jgi:hypothetical protein